MTRMPLTPLLIGLAIPLLSPELLRGLDDPGRHDPDTAQLRQQLREIRGQIDRLVDEGQDVPEALRDEAAALTDALRQRARASGQRTRRGDARSDDRRRGDAVDRPGFRRSGRPPTGGAGMQPARAVRVVDELLRLLDEQDAIRARIEEMGGAGEVPDRLTQAAERVERRTRELRQAIRNALTRRGFGHRDRPDPKPFDAGHGDRPPGPGRNAPMPHPPGPRPEPDRAEAVMNMLSDVAPEIAAEFQELRRDNPEAFRHRIHEAIPEARRLRQLREHDPEAFQRTLAEKRAEFRARRLARMARRAEGEMRERLSAELREHLTHLFEARMQSRDARIEQMEGELGKLRHDQERRRSERDELIERRLLELLGESLEF